MNIANQGFPATRADLNNALQAIATNNSGTSAPSTTFANQWFYNETSNKLFIRNEANNAFIEVATLDQTNNEWQITTGVIQAKDSDGLALKTDDGTTRLFIKDSNGAIGLGTESPTRALHVNAGTSNEVARFESSDTEAAIELVDTTGSAKIASRNDLRFFTDGGSTRAMDITSAGNVGIGNSSPPEFLTIGDSTADGASRIQFFSTTNGVNTIHFGDGAGSAAFRGYIQYAHNNDSLTFGTIAANQALITSDGVFQMKQLGLQRDGVGTDTVNLTTTKTTTSGTLNFDFVVDVDNSSWTPLGFFIHVTSVNSGLQRTRNAHFFVRGATFNGSLGNAGVADSGGDTSDISVAISDQGGTDPMTVRVAITHPNNRCNATVQAQGHMGIQRCD